MAKIDRKALDDAWGAYLNGDKGRRGFQKAVRRYVAQASLVPYVEDVEKLVHEIEYLNAKVKILSISG